MSDLPNFKFDLEKAEGLERRGRLGEAAHRRRVSRCRRASPRYRCVCSRARLRELHWHAIAAEWAYVISRPLQRHRHRAVVATPRFRTSAPATSGIFRRATAIRSRGSRPERVPLPLDLRRWPVLRVRNVQHHRLDGAHAAGGSGAESRACPATRSRGFRKKKSTSSKARSRPRSRRRR